MMRCLFVLLVLLAGCQGPAQKTEIKNGYTVEFLFEQDGCKVYRFEDAGTHYFVTRSGMTISHRRSGDDGIITEEIYTK
jgi:hypothetical protein